MQWKKNKNNRKDPDGEKGNNPVSTYPQMMEQRKGMRGIIKYK